MSHTKSLIASGVLLLGILSGSLLSNSKATPATVNQALQKEGEQPIQALLSEVRELRLAIQRTNLNTYHAQVTLERLRAQQQRVDRVSEKLDDIRSKIADLKSHQPRFTEVLKQAEDNFNKETDPAKRKELEDFLQSNKLEMNRLVQLETQTREQETQLAGQLQLEQAKLSELNDQLDSYRKKLEVVDQPQSIKKTNN